MLSNFFHSHCNIMTACNRGGQGGERSGVGGGVGGWEEDEVGGGGGWAAGGGLYLPLGHRQQYCVFSKWHKHTQSTGQADSYTVVGSSLARHTPLLVPLTGSTGPIMHLHGLTGSVNSHLWKQTWPSVAICLVCLDSARVWDIISCAIKDRFCKSSHIIYSVILNL